MVEKTECWTFPVSSRTSQSEFNCSSDYRLFQNYFMVNFIWLKAKAEREQGCPTKVHFQSFGPSSLSPPPDKFDLWLSSRRYLPSSKSVLQLTQTMNSGKNQIFETDLSFVQLRRYCVHFLFIRSKIDILLNATPDKPQSYDSFRSVWSPSRSVKVDLVENFWTNCLLEHIISLTFW